MVAPHVPGNYGYNHRGRVARLGDQAGTYLVEINTIAPGSLWGPVPSITPDLAVGDLVLMAQVGTTRGDLVIIGKIPGAVPGYTEVPGLVAELATKANQADLTALTGRVTVNEANIGSNTTAISALQARATTDEANITANTNNIATNTNNITTNTNAIAALQGRATTDEANITALQNSARASYDNDYEIDADIIRTMDRASAVGTIALTNGRAFYGLMRCHAAHAFPSVKFCLTTAGAGGTLAIGVWSGASAAALAFRGSGTVALSAGRQNWALSTPVTLAAGDRVAIGLLGIGNTAIPALAASGSMPSGMFNEDSGIYTALSSASTSLTGLPATTTDFTATANFVLLQQIPWLAVF